MNKTKTELEEEKRGWRNLAMKNHSQTELNSEKELSCPFSKFDGSPNK